MDRNIVAAVADHIFRTAAGYWICWLHDCWRVMARRHWRLRLFTILLFFGHHITFRERASHLNFTRITLIRDFLSLFADECWCYDVPLRGWGCAKKSLMVIPRRLPREAASLHWFHTTSGCNKCPFQLSWKCQLWASISNFFRHCDPSQIFREVKKNLLYYQGKSQSRRVHSQGVVSLKHSENVWTGGHPSIMVVDIVIVIKSARQVYTALLFCLKLEPSTLACLAKC